MEKPTEVEVYVAESRSGSRYFTTSKPRLEKFLKKNPAYTLHMHTVKCTQEAWDAMMESYEYRYTIH